MSLAITKRGTVSAAVTRQVAAGQRWTCAGCATLLPAAFQIDHINPLWAGGADELHNLQALCANCHADKTQKESILRRENANKADKLNAYDNRTDIVISPTKFQCVECLQIRHRTTAHPVCWVIERRFSPEAAAAATRRVATALASFEFAPFNKTD
ncbi:MAG: hypothetical protein CL678_17575 [Bdellovibrionaceae bacterium]|nr:hypothetical protein [Pseudobdellovibrionaceae bacterium]